MFLPESDFSLLTASTSCVFPTKVCITIIALRLSVRLQKLPIASHYKSGPANRVTMKENLQPLGYTSEKLL